MNRKSLVLGYVCALLAGIGRAEGALPVTVSDSAFSFNLLRHGDPFVGVPVVSCNRRSSQCDSAVDGIAGD
jgi:hypothetical protein